jgi:hypothetical protein
MCKKIRIRSWIINPDHIFESLETIFRVALKILKFFDADPGWEIDTRIRDGKNSDRGSGINIPDAQR